ncbi:MATE family efflux transporter [Clostridium tertium]|jgi:putative MATE family efflux protein|uniref:Multidrug export protein MepA n=1 Tax=Clostridium tertium TaxID=1559 RepID=A0A9X4B1A7_9CLOT|nr:MULTISPECIES: MATE family efflux transporter [Clostridium]EEH98506.1 MATE efflux family protein [Clostridium sp. 7_2_43FAA]MBU6137085.1 MATE family efflux transporter [Clostridium tertium]MDB1923980.1 MATE family efflux transporter [Clostridium tertium]MDB1927276.1 MATE family efflux transporter [Clostridium tertium]MDB1931052.1 MATE family efflux transporter [Clostridium tertium]
MDSNLSLKKQFFKYLVPSVTAMWIFSLYTMIDGIFVSRGVGETALAAVNIAMPFVNFIFAISMLFSTGASTIISIYIGKNNIKKANEIFSFNLFCMLTISLLITLLCLLNIDRISLFLGATENTFYLVKDYLKIIISFNGFFIISYCLEVLTKADGYPYLAIVGMIISALTNIILDFLFVIVLDFGIKGAAYATIISQGVSFIFFLSHFMSKKSKLTLTKFEFKVKYLKRILSIGFPDAITELTSGIVILLFNQTILIYIGESGIVTYSIICYVGTLVIMTMIAITQGMQPLCSYYYGKEEFKTIKKLIKMGLKAVSISSIAIFIICIVFAKEIVYIFIKDSSSPLFTYSISAFRLFSSSFLVLGFNVLVSGYFASIEEAFKATIISISRGLIFISLALFSLSFYFGDTGIWIATLISELICLLLSSYLLLKRNKIVT